MEDDHKIEQKEKKLGYKKEGYLYPHFLTKPLLVIIRL
jgi:hypothetical protein